MKLDKLAPGHIHLCLKCQAPYTLHYKGNKEPDMMYVCHCGEERAYGDFKKLEAMTATELEERYRRLGAELQEEMCKLVAPFIRKALEILERRDK